MKVLEAIGQVLWVLILTCGVLVLAYWSTRRVAGHLSVKRGSGGRMEVLDQIALGRDQRLVLARVGKTVYLLGVSSGSVSCLHVLTDEEARDWLTPGSQQDPGGSGGLHFREALRSVLEQRRP